MVRLYWPAHLRPAFDALFALDDAMGDAVARSSQPALGAIKLAWWRERLGELEQGKVPAEPRLQAAAAELLPRELRGADLAALEDGWQALLQERPDPERALNRGATLFALAGRILGGDPPDLLLPAGRLYAAGNLQRRGLSPDGTFVITTLPQVPSRFRPLTGLAALSKRDLHRHEAEATPGRAWTLLRHRLFGTFPRG